MNMNLYTEIEKVLIARARSMLNVSGNIEPLVSKGSGKVTISFGEGISQTFGEL